MNSTERRLRDSRLAKMDDLAGQLHGLMMREKNSSIKFLNPDTRVSLERAISELEDAAMYEEIATDDADAKEGN